MSAENNKTLQYINEYYESKEPKLTHESLFEMIEQAIEATKIIAEINPEIIEAGAPEILSEEEEKRFNVKKFMSTALSTYQVPSSQAGKAGTEERKRFQFHIASQIGKKGGNLAEKIEAINLFVEGSAINADASIATILSHCGTLSILQQMVEDFNASAAGFAFEAFLAALLSGVQIDDPIGGSLPIEDAVLYMDSPSTGQGGTPVSLKLLNKDTKIEGSIENLLTFLGQTEAKNAEGFLYIEYIVAIKHSDKHLGFNSFTVSVDNFFEWINRGYFNWDKIQPSRKRKQNEAKEQEEEQDEESNADLDELKAKVDRWKKIVSREYFPFWGFKKPVRPDSISLGYYVPSPKRDSRGVAAGIELIRVAMSLESKFVSKQGLWKNLPEDYYFSSDDQKRFKAIEAEGIGKEDVDFINIMLEKMKGRRDYFLEMISGHGRGTRLSPVPMYQLYTAIHGGEKLPGAESRHEKSGEKYLNKILADTTNDERFKDWADAIKRGLKKNQFHISNASVTQGKRSDATHYGTLKIDKKVTEKILKIYSQKLLVACAPIYEALGELTDNINRFFLGKEGKRKANAAIAASKNANDLSVHAEKLKDESVEN